MEMLCCCSSLPRQEERGCGEGGVDGVWNGCIRGISQLRIS
jgi:hypothetical protein